MYCPINYSQIVAWRVMFIRFIVTVLNVPLIAAILSVFLLSGRTFSHKSHEISEMVKRSRDIVALDIARLYL